MAHILEEFAKLCNVSPKRARLEDHFFPIAFDKYIILECATKEESRSYTYWNEVLDLIQFNLNINGVKIVQIVDGDGKFPPMPKADLTLGILTRQQKAYVIKNSLAFVGSSGLSSHMASTYNIPSVSLHAKFFAKNDKPYWTDDNICLEPEGSKKPSL